MSKQVFTVGQVLTAAQMTTLQANDYNQTVSAKVASYVLVAADAGTRITMSNASATTVTVNTALFTAGDTLTITNIGAGVCTITAGTATVSTAGSLALNQYDSGTLYFTSTGVSIWNGANPGDITGVTAGTGISGGGTSGTVTVSIDTAVTADLTTAQTMTNKTLTTPKISNYTTNGDLVYGTGSSVITRLGIGSTSQVLTVTGGVPVWATPGGGGGMTLLSTTNLTGSSVTVSSIDQTYNNLYLLIENIYPAADSYIFMTVNSDTTATNYVGSLIGLRNGTMAFRVDDRALHAYGMDGGTARANLLTATLYNYAGTTFKTWATYASIYGDGTTPFMVNSFGNTIWYGSAAITSLTFTQSGSSFSAGTVKIYGVK